MEPYTFHLNICRSYIYVNLKWSRKYTQKKKRMVFSAILKAMLKLFYKNMLKLFYKNGKHGCIFFAVHRGGAPKFRPAVSTATVCSRPLPNPVVAMVTAPAPSGSERKWRGGSGCERRGGQRRGRMSGRRGPQCGGQGPAGGRQVMERGAAGLSAPGGRWLMWEAMSWRTPAP